MMNIRLAWEDNRQTGWKERRRIIDDLHNFAVTRARWTPSIYELSLNSEDLPNLGRRGSIASQGSANSDNIINSPAFSRSARFKLAEILSRDAAQFSGRVTSLKHGTVQTAGKALDRLIDHSRKPVPEELLDEQDRLEERCINEMENIGKFTMALVMQWRKYGCHPIMLCFVGTSLFLSSRADEIYVETMKDQASALNLLEEIETAKLYHPTARQSISFISRTDTVMKRLAVRGDPASSTSMFPRPEQHLFPDQKDANETLVESLSGHITTANKLARKVNQAAKEYRNTYEAAKRAETMLHSVINVSTILTTINMKLRDGLHVDGDGTPPNLSTAQCLDPASHSIFLAHLPSLLDDASSAIDNAEKYLQIAPSSIQGLEIPGIDAEFKENVAAEVQKLRSVRDETSNLCLSVASRVANLRECRKISSAIDSRLHSLKILNLQVSASIDRDRWLQESNVAGSPTPESSMPRLSPPSLTINEFEEQLISLSSGLIADVVEPLERLSTKIEPLLPAILKGKHSLLQQSIDSTYQLIQLLDDVRRQSSAMNTVRNEFYEIAAQIEDSKFRFINMIDKITNDSGETASNPVNRQAIQHDVTAFIERLSRHVFFVARHSIPVAPSLNAPPILDEFIENPSELHAFPALHIDLSAVDATVRADANSFVMRLNGGVEALTNLESQLRLAAMAKAVDSNLIRISADIDALAKELAVQKDVFSSIVRENAETISQLCVALQATQAMRSKSTKVTRSLSPINNSLRGMNEKSKMMEPSIRNTLYESRATAVGVAETRLSDWLQKVDSFNEEVCLALDLEHEYQENVKAIEERRLLKGQERLASEEMENILLEQKRAGNGLLLEEKLAEDRQRVLDGQRRVFEAVEERQRLAAAKAEQQHLEALEKQAPLATEKAERACLELDQLEIFGKLRAAEVELQEQRLLRLECEATGVRLAKEQERKQDDLQKLIENSSQNIESDSRGGKTDGIVVTDSNSSVFTTPTPSVLPTAEAVFTPPTNSNTDVDDAGELFLIKKNGIIRFLETLPLLRCFWCARNSISTQNFPISGVYWPPCTNHGPTKTLTIYLHQRDLVPI